MEAKIYREMPVYSYSGCCRGRYDGDEDTYIDLYADDLRNAKVGDSWSCSDQDQYPNMSRFWRVTVTVIYKDETGVLLRQSSTEYGIEERVWVELHK